MCQIRRMVSSALEVARGHFSKEDLISMLETPDKNAWSKFGLFHVRYEYISVDLYPIFYYSLTFRLMAPVWSWQM